MIWNDCVQGNNVHGERIKTMCENNNESLVIRYSCKYVSPLNRWKSPRFSLKIHHYSSCIVIINIIIIIILIIMSSIFSVNLALIQSLALIWCMKCDCVFPLSHGTIVHAVAVIRVCVASSRCWPSSLPMLPRRCSRSSTKRRRRLCCARSQVCSRMSLLFRYVNGSLSSVA